MMRLPPSVLLERLRERSRERGTAFVLALAIEILIVLLLIFMAPTLPGTDKGQSPNVFGIDLGTSDDAPEATPQKQQERSGKAQPTPLKPVEPPPRDKPPLPDPPVELPPSFLKMTRAEYRAADIAGKGNEPRAPDSGDTAVAQSGSSGHMPGDSDVVGKAPNGEPLYAAEWYRRPTQAELSAYLPRGWANEGVGVVACRTAARYHVEDCKLLAQSPPGAGYGNAVLQSAWQFLVRPPRVGGKELVGSWVSIKIDYLVVRK